MIRRVMLFIFPFLFVLAEYVIRQVENAEAGSFIGPTLASVGIGQLFPLVVVKEHSMLVPPDKQAEFTMVNKLDKKVSEVAWVSIIICSLIWFVLLCVSLRREHNDVLFGHSTFYYGLGTYFFAVVLSEVKDWIV